MNEGAWEDKTLRIAVAGGSAPVLLEQVRMKLAQGLQHGEHLAEMRAHRRLTRRNVTTLNGV
jgi:hypothetical protein